MTLFEIHKSLAKTIGDFIKTENIHPLDIYKVLQALGTDCISIAIEMKDKIDEPTSDTGKV